MTRPPEPVTCAAVPHCAWLLAPAAEPVAAPTKAMVETACEFALDIWQILPAAWPRLNAWAGSSLSECDLSARARDRLVAVDAMVRLQWLLTARYLGELERRHIPHALLGGHASAVLAYAQPADRAALAVDIGVAEQCRSEAEDIACEQGFAPAEWNPATRRFEHIAAGSGGLFILARDQVVSNLDDARQDAIRRDLAGLAWWHETEDGELACYVTLNLRTSLAGGRPIDAALASATPCARDPTISLRVPSPAWAILDIVANIYFEGVTTYRRGHDGYADLIRLLPLLHHRDAVRLARMLEVQGLAVPAFYILRRLPSEFGIALPAPLAGLVDGYRQPRPDESDALGASDLGDVWSKLWGER